MKKHESEIRSAPATREDQLVGLRAASPKEQAFGSAVFLLGSYKRGWNMRKLSLALAALATIAVAAPTIASAEDFGVGVRIGGDRDRVGFRDRDDFRGARAEFRDHDRGFHRGWDRGWERDRGDRTVIIKQRRHRDWD
jgi:hypothetical protein